MIMPMQFLVAPVKHPKIRFLNRVRKRDQFGGDVTVMLTVTKRAVELLKATKAAKGVEENSGIRIRRGAMPDDSEKIGIGLQISDEPRPGDDELEQEGLRIFVEDALIDPLDGRTLDVRDSEEGPEFVFR
jgi:iron-sulfur cluster assembly protein